MVPGDVDVLVESWVSCEAQLAALRDTVDELNMKVKNISEENQRLTHLLQVANAQLSSSILAAVQESHSRAMQLADAGAIAKLQCDAGVSAHVAAQLREQIRQLQAQLRGSGGGGAQSRN